MNWNSLDKDSDIPVYSSVCALCDHLIDTIERKCGAFPGGIPLEIWQGKHDHKTPFPGDDGIMFLKHGKK